jgi:hypothetical protein
MYRIARQVAAARRVAMRPWKRASSSRQNGGRDDGWQFALGSSGPFGEDTDGAWQTPADAAYTWVAYQLGYSHYGPPSLDVWHDVHATRT